MKEARGAPAAPGVMRIELPTPYEVGPVNTYLLLGERPTLVDTGPGTEAALASLLKQLAALDAPPAVLEQIIITHTHVDHHGLLEALLKINPQLIVMAHESATMGFGREIAHRLAFYDELFARSGMPETMREGVAKGLRHMIALEPKVDIDVKLHDGDLITAGEGTWRVLHTPGHASNLINLYREATQTLITSDHVLPAVSSNAIIEPPPPGGRERSHSLIQYMDALRKVSTLPVKTALPGHGAPFASVASLVEERLFMHENRLVEIEARLGRPDGTLGLDMAAAEFKTQGATVFQLAADMFRPQDGDTLMLAMSEVQGHLDILAARERVTVEKRRGVLLYRSTGASLASPL